MILPATICFAALAILTLIAAATGYRGLVCDSERGYPVPDHVARTPHLAHRANQSVAFWCTGTALLSVAPLFPLIGMLTDGTEGQHLTATSLAVLATYGTLLTALGRLPFALIKRYTPA
ncbi:hypothetical protein [Yinghuangia sp. YIM S09857]|uniref:hypothetical protein n=1 Tax=Yinghuangia sp. YIM S09857 TaxID=3436929 RepID=UPI003F531C53